MEQRFSARKTIETALITLSVGIIAILAYDFHITYQELKLIKSQNAKESREKDDNSGEELSRRYREYERLRKKKENKHIKYC